MGVFDRIKGVFTVRLEEDEKVLLDERLGSTPSVVVGSEVGVND